MKKRSIKLALVCTPGGHYEQMLNLAGFYRRYPHFWITARTSQTKDIPGGEKKYYIKIAHFKRPWTYLPHAPKLTAVLLREKPTHIISTGSGRIVLVPFLLSRILGMRFIHIETFSHVQGMTKMGSFLLKMKHPILSQWQDREELNITHVGPIFKNEPLSRDKPGNPSHVFVTVGTRAEPFPRMIKAVEELIQEGVIREKVIVQAGQTPYKSSLMEVFDYCAPQQIDDLIINAAYVITQESAGLATKCLKQKVKFLVMPRDYQYRELPAKSDMKEDLHVRLEEMGFTVVVNNRKEMAAAINTLNELKTGFPFDNSKALKTLTRLVEGG